MNHNFQMYSSEDQRRRKMDFVMDAGQTLLENGAEVARVEQTMEIMAKCYHLNEFRVYVLTNGIFASAGTAEISEIRHVPNRSIHLDRIAAVNELSRDIAAGKVDFMHAERRLRNAASLKAPSPAAQIIASAFGSLSFAVLFGASLPEGIISAIAGMILGWYTIKTGKVLKAMFQRLSGAALVTVICVLLCTIYDLPASHSIIGALMLLTPGVSFTMSIRDFVHADYLSGIIQLIDAVIISASIACGAGLAIGLIEYFTGMVIL